MCDLTKRDAIIFIVLTAALLLMCITAMVNSILNKDKSTLAKSIVCGILCAAVIAILVSAIARGV